MTLTLVPLHTQHRLIRPCIEMLLEQWPHCKAHRLEQLEKSCTSGLPPCSVVLVGNLGQTSERVIAHNRLVPIKNIPGAVYVEDGLTDKEFRGLGFQKPLMNRTEEYCKNKGFQWIILDTSPATSKGLLSIGYKYRDWRVVTIGSGMLATFEQCSLDIPYPGWECFYRKPNQLVIDSPVRASILKDQPSISTYNPCIQMGKQEKREEGKHPPPSWSLDYFDWNYCWLQKQL